MPRYIDADEFEKRIKPYDTDDHMDKALYNFAHNKMMDTPTADVVKRKKGEWILDVERGWDGTNHWHKECSECSYELGDNNKNMNFCPNCGADMRDKDAWIPLPEPKKMYVNIEETWITRKDDGRCQQD